jgi:uncharacterized membrane protein YgdD (TMEM256/DUF423 family)
MDRMLLRMTAINGFLAVALGAFGAHGLEGYLEGSEDASQRLEWWRTAAHYQLAHALALGISACAATCIEGRLARFAGWAFQAGILLFSGSLYAMTLTDLRVLGMITPVGGLALLAGWAMLLMGASRLSETDLAQ